jgi:hypothetical protein
MGKIWGGDEPENANQQANDNAKQENENDDKPVPMTLPWLMAAADPEEWERRRYLPKRIGELSEAAFLLKASGLGLGVAKPWGESERYDFIVCGRTGAMWRVQVKSTSCKCGRGYQAISTCNQGGFGKSEYTVDEIDFLVVHIRPIDTWYVLPVTAFVPTKSLNFYPGVEAPARARWEKYREAWHLLEGERKKVRRR